jgi:hypothetical protein
VFRGEWRGSYSIVIPRGTTYSGAATTSLGFRGECTTTKRSYRASGGTAVDLLDGGQIKILLRRIGFRRVDIGVGREHIRMGTMGRALGRAMGRTMGRTLRRSVENHWTRSGITWDNVGCSVDILVLDVDAVVVLRVLVHICVGFDGNGSAEALATIVAGGSTHGGTTLRGLPTTLRVPPATLERRFEVRELRVLILVLKINGVVILVELVHVGVEVTGDGLAEADASVMSRGTTNCGATVGARESLRPVRVVRTATRTANGGASLFGTDALLKHLGRGVECTGRRARGSMEISAGRTLELGRRVDNNRSLVDVLVLDINRMVILVVVIDLSVENAGHGHIEALSLIVTRRASHSSTTRSVALSEGTHSWNLGSLNHRGAGDSRCVVRSWVHILVLHVAGVVILAPLMDLSVDFNVGRVGAGENSVTVISGRSTDSGPTILRGRETMFLL